MAAQNLIGKTALVHLASCTKHLSSDIKIYAKCEHMNPTGAIKDRIVSHIFDCAESRGELKKGATVVAATSGNTGASVAMLSSLRGYKAIVITNSKTSAEKCDIMRAYGAEVIVGPSGVPADSPDHYQNMAKALCDKNPEYFDVNQYDNSDNPAAYTLTLGPEILLDCPSISHFVAAGSTGGTFSGTSKFLKSTTSDQVSTFLADPIGSIFFEYWQSGTVTAPGKFKVEGVGKDSIPGVLNIKLCDGVVRVSDEAAFARCHQLAEEEGLLVGGSSGLNVQAAVQLAESLKEGPATIVTVLPDSGFKYLSKVFNPEWLEANAFQTRPGCPVFPPRNPDDVHLE